MPYFGGKVGIGTTTPAAALEVTGTTKFDGLATFGGVLKASGGIMYGDGTLQTTKISANLAAIATLRWYTGNISYPVGSVPFGVAFDGANIWVANQGDGTVTEILPEAQ